MKEAHEWAAKEEEKAQRMLREATWRMPKQPQPGFIWDRPEDRCGESKAEQAEREKREEMKKIQAIMETAPTKESEEESRKEIEKTQGNMEKMVELQKREEPEEERESKRRKQEDEPRGGSRMGSLPRRGGARNKEDTRSHN